MDRVTGQSLVNHSPTLYEAGGCTYSPSYLSELICSEAGGACRTWLPQFDASIFYDPELVDMTSTASSSYSQTILYAGTAASASQAADGIPRLVAWIGAGKSVALLPSSG